MYHISPLPPVIGMCLKDVHCPSTALGSSRSLSWLNLSCLVCPRSSAPTALANNTYNP